MNNLGNVPKKRCVRDDDLDDTPELETCEGGDDRNTSLSDFNVHKEVVQAFLNKEDGSFLTTDSSVCDELEDVPDVTDNSSHVEQILTGELLKKVLEPKEDVESDVSVVVADCSEENKSEHSGLDRSATEHDRSSICRLPDMDSSTNTHESTIDCGIDLSCYNFNNPLEVINSQMYQFDTKLSGMSESQELNCNNDQHLEVFGEKSCDLKDPNGGKILDFERSLLLEDLLGTAAEQKLNVSSTPRKTAAHNISLEHLLFSPIMGCESQDSSKSDNSSEDSDCDSSDSPSDCESEQTASSGGGDDNEPDFPINESLLQGLLHESLNDSLVTNNEDPENCSIHETDNDHTLSKACLLNNIKVHDATDFSINEGLLKIMKLYIKNRQSKSGLQRAVNTICDFLPQDHKLPTSSHQILKYVEELGPPVPADVHYYCASCLYYHGTVIVGQCEICMAETKFGHFFSFDVAALIRYFFESRNLATIMDEELAKVQEPSVLRNIRDGTVYKAININRRKYDLTIIVNNDGVRVRKGSTRELWLNIFTIAELPLHLQRSFLTVQGVWYDDKKPNMKTFLKPFTEKMESLDQGNESGVVWTDPVTKQVQRSCVRIAVAVCDAPARAITQNIQHFNGRYGCNICEVKSQLTAHIPGKKRLRIYHYVHNPKLRTQERMLQQARDVGNRKHLKGVKGPSVLSIVPSVNVSQCFVPEYLHSVLIGVCKQLLHIWTLKDGNWSLKDKITEIDAFLRTFRHPSFVHRILRQLKSLKYWKASDFYYFLLFEALPTLRGHLPDVYLQHFTLLVIGIFKLLKTSVTEADINEADLLLRLFSNDFGRLYGERELVYNVHQLTHLGLCVRRYGPLHCFSAFQFEDLNGLIVKTTHGTNKIASEIVRNIKICQGINILKNIVEGHHGLNVLNTAYSEGEVLGQEVRTLPPPEELDLLLIGNCKIFSRAKLGYDVFTSEYHKTLQSENFYVTWSENGRDKYGSIKYFASTEHCKFVVIRLFRVDHTQVLYHRETLKSVEQVIPVNVSENLVAIRFSDILSTIVKVGKIGPFVYKRPNLYRFVM